jgi:hypothetical protein
MTPARSAAIGCTKIRAGKAAHAKHPLPAVLGIDAAGVVEAVGSRVITLRRGDEVYGMMAGVGGLPGTLAEFVAGDADVLAYKPDRLSMPVKRCSFTPVRAAWGARFLREPRFSSTKGSSCRSSASGASRAMISRKLTPWSRPAQR